MSTKNTDKKNVSVMYYLPPEKTNKSSNLNTIKSKFRAVQNTNSNNIPQNMNDLKLMRRRTMAIDFMNKYMNNEVKSKSEFIKNNKISMNTLNKGLEEIGHFKKYSKNNSNNANASTAVEDNSEEAIYTTIQEGVYNKTNNSNKIKNLKTPELPPKNKKSLKGGSVVQLVHAVQNMDLNNVKNDENKTKNIYPELTYDQN